MQKKTKRKCNVTSPRHRDRQPGKDQIITECQFDGSEGEVLAGLFKPLLVDAKFDIYPDV